MGLPGLLAASKTVISGCCVLPESPVKVMSNWVALIAVTSTLGAAVE